MTEEIYNKVRDAFAEQMDKAFLFKFGVELKTTYAPSKNNFAFVSEKVVKERIDTEEQQFIYNFSLGYAAARELISK